MTPENAWHMWDDLGDYVKKTVSAHHGCVKDHYAVPGQAAADQAADPQRTAGQATAARAGNRARVVRFPPAFSFCTCS